MRNLITLFILISISIKLSAQDYSNLKNIPLKDSIQCMSAEPKVLECSEYLLSTPYSEDLNSLSALQFLLEWMGQTPEYTFSFEDKLYNSIKSDLILSSRYLASQCKTALIQKSKSYDSEFQIQYISTFLEYCENPKNKVKITSKIKKLIEAKNKGSLKDIMNK